MSIDIRTLSAILALVAVCVLVLSRLMNLFPPDLSALYMAGHLFADGQYGLIYSAPDNFFDGSPPDWQPLLPALGL